jgi:hypothetical protein
MQADDSVSAPDTSIYSITQNYRAEIASFLRREEYRDNVMSIVLHYSRSGKRIFEILRDMDVFEEWFKEDRILIGTYSFTSSTDVSIYIGAHNTDDIYFRLIKKKKDKDV